MPHVLVAGEACRGGRGEAVIQNHTCRRKSRWQTRGCHRVGCVEHKIATTAPRQPADEQQRGERPDEDRGRLLVLRDQRIGIEVGID